MHENFKKIIKISFFSRKKRDFVVAFSRKNGIKVMDIDTLKVNQNLLKIYGNN